MVEYILRILGGQSERPGGFQPTWFLSLALNAMLTADQFRRMAGNPGIEYGLESEIVRIPNEPLAVAKLAVPSRRRGGMSNSTQV